MSKRSYLLTPPSLDEMKMFDDIKNQQLTTNENRIEEIKSNINALKQQKNEINTLNNLNTDSVSFVNLDDDFDSEESKAVAGDIIQKIMQDEPNINIKAESLKPSSFSQIEIPGAEKKSPVEIPKNYYKKPPKYSYPSLDLLKTIETDNSDLQESIQRKAIVLENALETFNINAKVIRIVVGPAVARYELEMPVGVPVKKILSHADDIALNLASKGDIRIEAPIPGRSAVGIEVPNDKISTVGIKKYFRQRIYGSKSAINFCSW